MNYLIAASFLIWCAWSGYTIGFIMVPVNFIIGVMLGHYLGGL